MEAKIIYTSHFYSTFWIVNSNCPYINYFRKKKKFNLIHLHFILLKLIIIIITIDKLKKYYLYWIMNSWKICFIKYYTKRISITFYIFRQILFSYTFWKQVTKCIFNLKNITLRTSFTFSKTNIKSTN